MHWELEGTTGDSGGRSGRGRHRRWWRVHPTEVKTEERNWMLESGSQVEDTKGVETGKVPPGDGST